MSEPTFEEVSADVQKTLGHLHANRTTEHEARTLQEAARRSLREHATAKSMRPAIDED